MSAKHSEGPWGVSHESPRIIKQYDCLGESNVIIGSASGYPNSGFFPSDEEAIANARVMGASLDLLRVTEAAIQWMQGDKWRFDKDPMKRESWEITMNAMKAAVAKAKGE